MRIVEDSQIKAAIMDLLKGTPFVLVHFERNHMCFGNMIAKIRTEKREHVFVSDSGDITWNGRLVFPSANHIAGEDDAPKYFMKAIEQFVRDLAANYETEGGS